MTIISSTGTTAPPSASATPPDVLRPDARLHADPRLHKAAQAFEAIFVRQMLSSARQGNFGDTLWGSDQGHDTFTAMRDEKFADIAAQSGTLGLGQQIEKQLAGKSGAKAGARP